MSELNHLISLIKENAFNISKIDKYIVNNNSILLDTFLSEISKDVVVPKKGRDNEMLYRKAWQERFVSCILDLDIPIFSSLDYKRIFEYLLGKIEDTNLDALISYFNKLNEDQRLSFLKINPLMYDGNYNLKESFIDECMKQEGAQSLGECHFKATLGVLDPNLHSVLEFKDRYGDDLVIEQDYVRKATFL